MPLVSGLLKDYTASLMSGYSPELHFIPNTPGLSDARVYASKPIITVPNPITGRFEVDLVQTDTVTPEMWFTLEIWWLDSVGGYVGKDYLDWKIRVPAEGGYLYDLTEAPTNPARVWVGLIAPPNPSTYQWWLEQNPLDVADPLNTGNLYEWI